MRNIEIEAQQESQYPRQRCRHEIVEKCSQGTRIDHATGSKKLKAGNEMP
jgi:hypothetical protein